MQVRCPDCRESIEVEAMEVSSDMRCASCGTAFNLVGDETVEYRSEQPTEIGHFRLQERIGSGAFGTVYKAYDADLDRIVAVKVPHRGEMTPQQTDQFLREARASAQLRHPNIVAVHEVGRERDTAYLVMDYVDGITLADEIANGRWPHNEAAGLCATIAEAVHDAHQAGVVHRDLKPANILLDSQREPHITDFGLAKRTADDVTMTMDGRILGSPAYMSPEQARGDASRIDARTDVYSLGVILFELLTHERPFRGDLRMLLNHVIESDPPRPREYNRHVPRDLEIICLKCLEKEPRRRYASAAAFAEDLRRFLAGKPIQAHPTAALVRAQRWCRRNLVVAALASVLFAVLALGLITTTTLWSRAERNAEREAELREQVETLTKELLELAEQLRGVEIAQAPKTSNQAQPSAPTLPVPVFPAPTPATPIADDQTSPESAQPPKLGQARSSDHSSRSSRPRAPTPGGLGGTAKSKDAESQQVVDADLATDDVASQQSMSEDAPVAYAIAEGSPTAGAREQMDSRLGSVASPRKLRAAPPSADRAAILRAKADKKLEQLERLSPAIARQYRRLLQQPEPVQEP